MIKMILGKRKQYFEIQDFPWCPKTIRDGVTDYLAFSLKIAPLYKAAIPALENLFVGEKQWIDLCAGGGGGSIPLFLEMKKVRPDLNLVLTDLYPNQGEKKFPPAVHIHPEPVDATQVPVNMIGVRTLFTSFHHLPDSLAKSVLADAFHKKQKIAVFEFTERNLYCLLMTFPTLFFSFLTMILVRPWSLARFFWTYILPAIPIVATVDIILSSFRTRTTEELELMVSDLKAPDYQWEIGQWPTLFGFKITYLIGKKK
ncbi:MAG: hypothetical protein ACOYL6_18225 [Bacteriovoracaceae bacterium]